MKKSNIEWCDYVLNPIIGCKHNCNFCYAERENKRFKWVKKWNEPEIKNSWIKKLKAIKEPSIIFIGSHTDLFGNWVEGIFIECILKMVKDNQQHTFMFLTKNPARYKEFEFYDNCMLGVTVTSNIDKEKSIILNGTGHRTFLSIEPLLGMCDEVYMRGHELIIVGAMTGINPVIPQQCWLDSIQHHNIFLKDNIKKYKNNKL